MIINKLVFPIKANLDYVEGSIPIMKLTANTLNRDVLYVISPAVGDTIIKGNFQNSLGGNEIVSSNFKLTDIKVGELVGEGESYYELVKDWNVWSSVIPNKALSYISSNRAGEIGLSFSFSEYAIPKIPKEIDFKGEVFEASQISGDGVWVVKITLFEYEGFDFGYNDLLIRLNGNVIQKKSILRRGNTGTINYSVDPSIYDTEFEEVEFNLVEELLGVVNETKSDYLILDNKVDLLDAEFDNYYPKTKTYSQVEIDNKDTNTLDSAKSYADSLVPDLSGIEQDITNLESDKLDRIWNDITSQSLTNLNDEFVLNRGGAVYKTTLANMLSNVVPIDIFTVVSVLPEVGLPNKIYLVPSDDPELQNALDEFIWIDNDWEMIGNVSVDLEDYYTINEVDQIKVDIINYINTGLNQLETSKQDKLVAGDNITIDPVTHVISASGGEVDLSEIEQDILDLQNDKVDKVIGKQLSDENFTLLEKNKLDGIEEGAEKNTVNSVNGKTGTVVIDKSDVGLPNVDDTADLDKPISTATQTALNLKADKTQLNNYVTTTTFDMQMLEKLNIRPNGTDLLVIDGMVNSVYIDSLYVTDIETVNTEAEMLALPDMKRGDMAIVVNSETTYVLKQTPSNNINNWAKLLTKPEVISVNGKTGIVHIGISDIDGLQGILNSKLDITTYTDDMNELDTRVGTLETSKQDKLVAGENITIDENTNVISADVIDLNTLGYMNYAADIFYRAKHQSLFPNAWEHSSTVDPLEISADSLVANVRGIAQYPNGEIEGVIIPNSVTSIGSRAFVNWVANNQPLVIPNSVTEIGDYAFNGWLSNNHPLVIPNSVTEIGLWAFRSWEANNQPLVIPNSVTSIGNYAFYNWVANNHPLTIPSRVTSIGNSAFYNWRNNNQPLIIPSSVTSIVSGAFDFWLANNHPLTIPSSVTSIGNAAFRNWVANNHPLTIPSSVSSIGSGAFSNWSLVKEFIMENKTPPTITATSFDNTNNAPFYVPDGSVTAYKTATNWVDLADRIFSINDR